MATVISIENLGKKYIIGHQQQERYLTLRDTMAQSFREVGRRLLHPFLSSSGQPLIGLASTEEFWALKDVSFDVQQGERVAIIGRNGAGKTTLLKVLSRITEPTAGRVTIKGRVASLLEVGTGFHPELTGRENIYLNGAILGMSKAEIRKKFDEIVVFAEVEKFLDTPVKRYSSGMYVRLAFAVAAHLEPEILIVDEVLAVGDAGFQKKCLGKMAEAASEGRTVLFVSHNMGAILQLCSRAIILREGKCALDGDVTTAVSNHLGELSSADNAVTFDIEPHKNVQITSMSVVSADGNLINAHPHTHPFCVLVNYRVTKWHVGSYVCLDVFNETDVRLLWSSDVTSVEDMLVKRPPGIYQSRITIPSTVLSPGRYSFTAAVYAPGSGNVYDVKEKAISVEIADGGSFLSNFGIRPHAATMIPLSWDTRRLTSEV